MKINQYFIFLLVIIFIAACSDNQAKQSKDKKNRQIAQANQQAKFNKQVPVELITPELGLAASYYVTTTTLEPSSDAQISARTSGVIQKILHEEGDDVSAGDILLLLEDDDQKLRLKQAKQVFTSSEREYLRLNKMRSAGAVSANEWETANDAYLKAQTDLELAKLAISYTKVAAPFDGRVVWRELDRGDFVANGALLFRMMAVKPLLLRVHVPANRIGKITKGQKVKLSIDSLAKVLYGTIHLVSPIVDPETGTIKVTIELHDYPDFVRPGDYTEVTIITDQRENALLIPSICLIQERGEYYLFIEKDNQAIRKKVEVGYVVDDKTEILKGINLNDKIVIKGQGNLNDGEQIKIVQPKS